MNIIVLHIEQWAFKNSEHTLAKTALQAIFANQEARPIPQLVSPHQYVPITVMAEDSISSDFFCDSSYMHMDNNRNLVRILRS